MRITKLLALLGTLSTTAIASAAEISGTVNWTFNPGGLENVNVLCLRLEGPFEEVRVLASRPDWNYTCPDLQEGVRYKVFAGAVIPIAIWGPCEWTICGELYRTAGDGNPANFDAYAWVARVDLIATGNLDSLVLTARFYRLDGHPIGPTGVVEFWDYQGSFPELLSTVYVDNQTSIDSDTLSLAPGQHIIRALYHNPLWFQQSDPITVGGD